MEEYSWLSEIIETETTTAVKENIVPHADQQLIKLFKSVNDQGTMVSDDEIIEYIKAVRI